MHAWCVDGRAQKWRLRSCHQKTGNLQAWSLPARLNSSPPSYLPLRQPWLRNRSLFKSFMSTPRKRKACRKLRDHNEECVLFPLICNDLWHNGGNWFDNHSLFSLRREESLSQRFRQFSFHSLVFCFTDERLFFPTSSTHFSFLPPPSHPNSYSSHKYPFIFTNIIKTSPH